MAAWRLLAILFAARATMAFQFQSAAALSPYLAEHYGVGLAEIGLMIGLYLSPGLVAAYPGGAIGRRFGERRVVLLGLGLMALGGCLAALPLGWGAQLAARAVAGTGGVLLNILMSKMVADAFAGGRLATAMGVFVNSWPVGIAAALLVLPPVADSAGLGTALWLTAVLVMGGLTVFAFGVPGAADGKSAAPAVASEVRLSAGPLRGAIATGAVWGLYNGALGMIFGFGPALLAERGWPPVEAGRMTSAVLWLVAVSVPLGGFLADRTGRPGLVLWSSLAGFAVLLAAGASGAPLVAVFLAAGLVGGLPAGPIMSLPAGVLPAPVRAEGMGVFFTLFYAGTVGGPLLAGWLGQVAGTASAAFALGAVMVAACAPALLATRRIECGLAHSA
ncbi:MAG: MFS transporter [Pseudomonadota bacterium]